MPLWAQGPWAGACVEIGTLDSVRGWGWQVGVGKADPLTRRRVSWESSGLT